MSDFDTQPPSTDAVPADARQWGLFAHLSALIGLIIPFGNVLGPLIIWQVKKAEMPFVDDQGKEALNFQITVAIAMLICIVLSFVLIGLLLLPIVGIAALVFTIIGGIKANEGQYYRYPFALRLIK
ncbi:MAG: DUF4870 domain-containing protein [Lysobacteraceae bacterium]|uniref:DUF4870 domain-containing protein n=1 Tax=Denitratimonas sp. CY0512 TaxID=3131940 RepID=UPI0030A5D8E5